MAGLISIDTLHPLVDPKVEIANVVVASVAGVGDSVTFDVFQPGTTTPVADLPFSQFRFYIADIVPAGTTTTTTYTNTVNPVLTWATAEPERWLYEYSTSNPTGTFVQNTPGNYTYTFALDLSVGNVAQAPEFNVTHPQRLMIRVGDIADLTGTPDLSREAAIVEFIVPADGTDTGVLSQSEASFSRAMVPQEACTACHGDPLQSAAHGASYQTPQGCVICHSPIGNAYGDRMQNDGAWLAWLIHNIHGANATRTAWDWSEVTYPQNIKECEKCHIPNSGLPQATAWKTNPNIQACTSCHDVTFDAGTATHTGGPQNNGTCTLCHPADGLQTVVIAPISTVHKVDYDRDNLLYNVTISLSPDANADGVYEVGEAPIVTATVDFPGFDYLNTNTSFLRSAELFVYGPRSLAVPVMTPGSTTDPAFVPPTHVGEGTPPDQGRSMLASAKATDPNVLTDATGFKYQLLPVTEAMTAGTFMVQTNIDFSATGDRTTDGRHIGPRFYPLDGWELINFQVKTAALEKKVAGECTGCHEQRNFSTYAHRSYFGTDGCLACHDQSGNHADPITNRVHAVHAANTEGDLTNVPGQPPSRVWDEITFPRNLNASCAACHNSGNNSHRSNPNGSFGFACYGCHAGRVEGVRDHMLQMGAPFPVH